MSKLDDILETFSIGVSDDQWVDDGSIKDCAEDIKDLILELTSKPGDVIGYTDKQDNFATGYASALKDIRERIEEL